MVFNAKYKLPGQWFWRNVKRLKGDVIENSKQILIFEDERQLHLPITAVVLFDRGRYEMIKSRMEEEAGQDIKVKR